LGECFWEHFYRGRAAHIKPLVRPINTINTDRNLRLLGKRLHLGRVRWRTHENGLACPVEPHRYYSRGTIAPCVCEPRHDRGAEQVLCHFVRLQRASCLFNRHTSPPCNALLLVFGRDQASLWIPNYYARYAESYRWGCD